MFDLLKIPAELRKLRQWVSFKIGPELAPNGKPKKVPLIPGTDSAASPSNSRDWRSFEEAVSGGNPAFVLTARDPYVFIDIDKDAKDDTVNALLEAFPTWTEWSSSGEGLHIFGRGTLKHGGHRSGGIEVYDRDRFCIFTGRLFEGSPNRIEELNAEELEDLEFQMGAVEMDAAPLEEHPEADPDHIVIQKCDTFSAKFITLYRHGDWRELGYPSQSEADHALIGLIADHTKSDTQVERLFRKSKLFRPTKDANYVRRALQKVFRPKQRQKATTAELFNKMLKGRAEKPVQEIREVRKEHAENLTALYDGIPNGLLKDLFQAYQEWAYYPLKEGSLIAALATVTALFQRQYQTPTRLGLNNWLILLAPASSGKEVISEGPSSLFAEARVNLEGIWCGELRSDAGIDDVLRQSPRVVAYHPECAGWMTRLCGARDHSGFSEALRGKLLSTFTNSGARSIMHFGRKKKEKGSEGVSTCVERPCLTVLGEAVPELFFRAVTENDATAGFLQRFTVLEAPFSSLSAHPNNPRGDFPRPLLEIIHRLAVKAAEYDLSDKPPVEVAIGGMAKSQFEEYESAVRLSYVKDGGESGLAAVIQSRAPQKVAKWMTYLAICENPDRPQISTRHLDWAVTFVNHTDGLLVRRLTTGEHSENTAMQMDAMRGVIAQAAGLKRRERESATYCRFFTNQTVCTDTTVVPFSYVADRCRKKRCFSADRLGYSAAIQRCIQDLERCGDIVRIGRESALEKYQFGGELIQVVNLLS